MGSRTLRIPPSSHCRLSTMDRPLSRVGTTRLGGVAGVDDTEGRPAAEASPLGDAGMPSVSRAVGPFLPVSNCVRHP